MSRDVGRLGEIELERICHSIGVTVNPVHVDKTGWDFFLEFPLIQGVQPLDLSPPTIKCLIQVKSTDGQKRACNITVSNLKRFLEFPDPAFFVFIHFNGEEQVKEIYIYHFDETLIEKTLRKLRKLSQIQNIAMHKKAMLVTYGEKHKLNEPKAKDFIDSIKSHVPKGIPTYRKWKDDLIRTLGYEKYGSRLEIKINELERKKLAEASLKKEYSVDYESLKIWDERFGMPILVQESKRNEGKLFFQHINKKTYRSYFQSDTSKVWFDVKARVSPFEKAEKVKKIRISSDSFEMILSYDSNALTFEPSLDNEAPLSIAQIKSLNRLLRMMQSDKKILFTIENTSPLQIEFDPNEISFQNDIGEFIQATNALILLFEKYDLPPHQKFSLDSLYKSRTQLMKFPGVGAYENSLYMLELNLSSPLTSNKPQTIVLFLVATIGDVKIGILTTVAGTCIRSERDKYQIKVSDTKISESHIFYGESDFSSKIESHIARIENQLIEENVNIIKTERKPFFLY